MIDNSYRLIVQRRLSMFRRFSVFLEFDRMEDEVSSDIDR